MALRPLILILAIGLAACATPDHSLKHTSLRDGKVPTPPNKVLLVAPDMRISEISAGGVTEEVPEWTSQANQHLQTSLSAIAKELGLTTIAAPKLPPEQQDIMDQHVALYDLVAGNAFLAGDNADPAWAHKRQSFDYTLGPGLAFLPAQAGADAALFIVGADYISSGGRKAAMVVGALLGVVIPGGVSYLTAGVVDLKSGDLLWLNYELDPSTDLRQFGDSDKLLRKVFATYPRASSDQVSGP